jgi:hypothetical protein
MKELAPPALAERLLAKRLPSRNREAILGDLQETFVQIAEERGTAIAMVWYWLELARVMPGFLLYSFESPTLRRKTVTGTFFYRERGWTALLSLLLLLPAMLLVIPGLLFEVYGKAIEASLNSIPGLVSLRAWVDSPWIILGGLGITLLINMIAILHVGFRSTKQEITATLTWKRSYSNFIFLALAGFLAVTLLAYGIVENLLPLL